MHVVHEYCGRLGGGSQELLVSVPYGRLSQRKLAHILEEIMATLGPTNTLQVELRKSNQMRSGIFSYVKFGVFIRREVHVYTQRCRYT